MYRHRIRVPAGLAQLQGELVLPDQPRALALLVHLAGRLHPDGSSHSSRSEALARDLHRERLGTLALDLLTPSEEVAALRQGAPSEDLDLLAERIAGSIESLGRHPATDDLPLALVAWGEAGPGALRTAADLPQAIRALVVPAGALEGVRELLYRVRAPTLALLGGEDEAERLRDVLALASELGGPHDVQLVDGASHLFREPGALQKVSSLVQEWFERFLVMHQPGTPLRHQPRVP